MKREEDISTIIQIN